MSAVLQKIKVDLVSRPLISGLILLTITAAATLLTLALATLMNLSAPYDQAFETLNAAHLWLYFDRARVSERDLARIAALPKVAATTGVQYSTETRAYIDDNTRVLVSVRMVPETQPQVNRLLVTEGAYLADQQAEVVAAKDLDDLYTLRAGQAITLTTADGGKEVLPVVGLAYNPMWDTYRNTEPPYLYVNASTMRRLFPNEADWAWSMGLRLEDPQTVESVIQRIETLLHSEDAVTKHVDWRDVRESAMFGAQLNFVFLGAFGLFAILATILVIATSISSTVLSQFRQIGILKAVGFTRRQILWLYLGQHVILGLVGCALGLTVGRLLAPLPLKSVAASLSTPFEPTFPLPFVALIFVLILGIIIAATYSAARRGASANTIQAITTGAEPPRQKSLFGVEWITRLRAGMPLMLGFNDVTAKPFRSVMTGLNLTLGVIGIVFGLTLNRTLDTYQADPSLLGIVYDALVTRERFSDRKTQHLLDRAPGVDAVYTETLIDADTPQGQQFQIRAVEGDLHAFPFRITKGRFFRANRFEAIAGRGLLDWLGLDVGDPLTVILDEQTHRPITLTIVGEYPEPVNAGQMLMVDRSVIARLARDADPYRYYVRLASDANPDQLDAFLSPDADADLSVTLVRQAIPDAVIYLQLAIFALSAILIGIALINVFTTSLLAVQERVRTFGILKTVGMTPAQVILMVTGTSGALGLLATALGIPLGYALTQTLMGTLSQIYGFGDVRVTLGLHMIVPLIPLMMLVSMLGGLLPGRRAARLPIVKVLRHE